jgi:hypothetical protein
MNKKIIEIASKEIVVPDDTDELVRIRDIVIPPDFKKTNVKYYKIKKVVDYYEKYGMLDKPISIYPEIYYNSRHFECSPNKLYLLDEYSRYIAARYYLRLKVVPVKYISLDDVNYNE